MRNVKRGVFLVWVSVVLLACNMSGTSAPTPTPVTLRTLPTVPPRATLGYSTPIPDTFSTTVPMRESVDVQLSSQRTQVDINRMMLDIRALQNFGTRHVNSIQSDPNRGVRAAYDFLRQQFELIDSLASPDVSFVVDSQPFEAFFDEIQTEQYNIMGILLGTDPNAGTIVIGAHYDSRTDDQFDAQSFAPGADDNGSGVAAVLELARILTQNRHRASIIFVLFAAEEVGRQGSREFVNEYIRKDNIDVVAMLNLDTIGSANDANGTINDREIRLFSDDNPTNNSPPRHLARTIHFFGQNYNLPLSIDFQPALDREGRYGDQESFVNAGYPAVRFVEALEDTPNREGDDVIDHIEPDYLLRSTQTILNIVRSMADGLPPPETIELTQLDIVSESGIRQHRLTWNPVPSASRYIIALRPVGSMTYDVRWQFTVDTSEAIWDQFMEFEALAIATVDENGLIGRLSLEYRLREPRR